MSFRLVSKSVTLNDLERRNGPHFALFHRIRVRCRRKRISRLLSHLLMSFLFFILCRVFIPRVALQISKRCLECHKVYKRLNCLYSFWVNTVQGDRKF